MHSALSMHASIVTPGSSVTHVFSPKTRRAYLHLIMRSGYRKPSVSASDKYPDGGAQLKLNGGTSLEEGESLAPTRPSSIRYCVMWSTVSTRACSLS